LALSNYQTYLQTYATETRTDSIKPLKRMARYLDQLTATEDATLKLLCKTLKRAKPNGWSVVWRRNEISVRPPDRILGRFSIIFFEQRGFSVSFFSRAKGVWNKRYQFACKENVAAQVMHWMLRAAGDPETNETDAA
jgi:hypothetical protein